MLFTYLSLLNLCSSGFFSARGSQVEELSSESATALTAAVKNSGVPQALILLQYMRECGHCVNAAPKYLALAKKFPEFKFAAIDCSAMPNFFCQSGDFQLRAFPTIRLVSQGKIEELEQDLHSDLEQSL